MDAQMRRIGISYAISSGRTYTPSQKRTLASLGLDVFDTLRNISEPVNNISNK